MCALESSKQQAFSCCVALFYVVSLVGSKKQKFLPLALPLLLFPLPESFLIINRSSWRRLPVDCELKTFTATSHCVLGGRAIELPADVAAPTCRQGIIDALREQINSSSSPFFITWTPREESGLRCKIELDWIPIGFNWIVRKLFDQLYLFLFCSRFCYFVAFFFLRFVPFRKLSTW